MSEIYVNDKNELYLVGPSSENERVVATVGESLKGGAMRKFFHGWRRKVGCAMLVMALSFTAAWVRSSLVFDMVTIPVGNHNSFSFESKRQSLCLSWTQEHSNVAIGVPFAWHAMAPMDPMAASVKGTVLWNDDMIGEFGCLVALGEEYPHGIILIAPYWSAVAALTLLSACLILWPNKQVAKHVAFTHQQGIDELPGHNPPQRQH